MTVATADCADTGGRINRNKCVKIPCSIYYSADQDDANRRAIFALARYIADLMFGYC